MHFKRKPTIATFYDEDKATMLRYNSGADRHYLIEKDRKIWDYRYFASPPINWASQMAERATVSTSPNCPLHSSPKKRQKQTLRKFSDVIYECWQNSQQWQCDDIHQGSCRGIQIMGCINNVKKKTYSHRQTRWTRPVSHTINPGSQTMATLQTNEEIQEVSSTGQ